MRMHRRSFLAGVAAAGAISRPARAADSLRIAVISDLNGSYGSTEYGPEVAAAIARIVAMAPDLVICTGDMVAGQQGSPKLTEPQLLAMWAAFHAIVTDPLKAAGIPLLVTPGNHDASAYPGFELERQVYDRTWTERAPEVEIIDGERYPFRYAVSFQGVLLVGLDITTSGVQPVEETEWTAQLLREEAPRHRATIVFGHLPIWAVSTGRESDVIGDPAFQELVLARGASAYLSGHHHAYFPSRTGGLLQISQACLGNGPRKYLGTDLTATKAFGMLDIASSGQIDEQALAAPDFESPIALETLPEVLPSDRGRVQRRDLRS